jgi:hypothetical protein
MIHVKLSVSEEQLIHRVRSLTNKYRAKHGDIKVYTYVKIVPYIEYDEKKVKTYTRQVIKQVDTTYDEVRTISECQVDKKTKEKTEAQKQRLIRKRKNRQERTYTNLVQSEFLCEDLKGTKITYYQDEETEDKMGEPCKFYVSRKPFKSIALEPIERHVDRRIEKMERDMIDCLMKQEQEVIKIIKELFNYDSSEMCESCGKRMAEIKYEIEKIIAFDSIKGLIREEEHSTPDQFKKVMETQHPVVKARKEKSVPGKVIKARRDTMSADRRKLFDDMYELTTISEDECDW